MSFQNKMNFRGPFIQNTCMLFVPCFFLKFLVLFIYFVGCIRSEMLWSFLIFFADQSIGSFRSKNIDFELKCNLGCKRTDTSGQNLFLQSAEKYRILFPIFNKKDEFPSTFFLRANHRSGVCQNWRCVCVVCCGLLCPFHLLSVAVFCPDFSANINKEQFQNLKVVFGRKMKSFHKTTQIFMYNIMFDTCCSLRI